MITWSTNEVMKAPEVLFIFIRYYLQGVFVCVSYEKIKVVDAGDTCNFYANAKTLNLRVIPASNGLSCTKRGS
jgi:hypothetical protein